MTKTEFAAGWDVFAGTCAIQASRGGAYWLVLQHQDAASWLNVARYYAEHYVTGEDVPTPSEVSSAVARESSNAEMADANCPHCEHGQILLWRVSLDGQNFYLPLDATPFEVAQCVSLPLRQWSVARTTASCDCCRGRSLRAAMSSSGRVLRPYRDLVGADARTTPKTCGTTQGAIDRAIRETVGGVE